MYKHLRFKVSMNSVASPDKVKRRYWRMMTCLFSVDRTTIYEPLKCFAKDWVEGLFDVKIQDRVCK